MRIGHFAPHLWAEGGIAAYVARLGAAQAARGHEVVYFSFDAPGTLAPAEGCIPVASEEDLFQRARDLDLDVLHLHKPVQSLPADRVTTVRTMHGNQGHCPSGSRYLARTGRGCERDVGLVACLWGHLIDHCGSRRPRQIQADFASIRLEHEQAATLRTSVVSSYLKRQMVRAGCPADRLHVLLSPAPDVPQAPAPLSRHGWPRFVFVGRLTPQKGADWLLRAAARVEDPIALDIAGDGPERAALEHLAQALGIAERTRFHGWISEDDVQRLFAGARAVVVPSVWQEPAGLVTLEAAAAGRAVIASRVGGIPEYAGAAFSLLVPPRDVDGMAAALSRLAADPAQAEQLGIMARTMARTRFAMERFLTDLDQFYDLAITEDSARALGEDPMTDMDAGGRYATRPSHHRRRDPESPQTPCSSQPEY